MLDDPTIRAFELARSGTCASVEDIRKQLKRERYAQVDRYLGGRGFQDQLKKLIREARTT